MTANAVLSGTYSDFKIVKTRSVFQMVIEGPIERAAEAVAMFGVPQPGQEIHVAVARLQVPHDAREAPGETTPSTRKVDTSENPPALARPNETAQTLSSGAALRGDKSAAKERFKLLGEPEQMVSKCAMLCADHGFQNWLRVHDAVGAAIVVRARCGIESRSELASNPAAAEAWRRMLTDYDIWANRLPEQRS